jgi:AcrR family transcriptional regulator
VTSSRVGRPRSAAKGRRADSSERILEAASALMAERGFAATSISALSERCGFPASSIYWHFGSKEGLLAAVMESGNERWLNSLPRADELSPDPRQRVAELFDAIARGLEAQPEFLRLMMLLALERRDVDPALLEGIRRVRRRALDSARPMIEALLAPVAPPEAARRIADELSLFTLVFADGSFLAHQIDPQVDLRRLFDHLRVGLLALAERLVGEGA